MLRPTLRSRSPVHQALRSTGFVVIFGLAVRFIWGAFDPEMRTWTFVGLAPVAGVLAYLQATGRLRAIATALVGLGLGGLLFWTLILVWGGTPITGRADYAYIALVFAFPAASLGLGIQQLRKLSTASQVPPSA